MLCVFSCAEKTATLPIFPMAVANLYAAISPTLVLSVPRNARTILLSVTPESNATTGIPFSLAASSCAWRESISLAETQSTSGFSAITASMVFTWLSTSFSSLAPSKVMVTWSSFLKPYASFTSAIACSIPFLTSPQNSPLVLLLTTATRDPAWSSTDVSISGIRGSFSSWASSVDSVVCPSETSGAITFSTSSFLQPVKVHNAARTTAGITATFFILFTPHLNV